jgi:hypothetical protein
VLVCLAAVTVAFMVYLRGQGEPLRQFDVSPHGILDLELARDSAAAGRILAAWNGIRETVRTQIRVDFGFLVAYPLFLSLACAMLSQWSRAPWTRLALVLSWAVLLACPLDATENVALLHMLDHGASDGAARLGSTAATVKWILAIAALFYGVLAGLVGLIRTRMQR